MRALPCIALLVVALPAVAIAAPAGERYYVEIKDIDAVPAVPANVSVKARQIFTELLGTRPEFVTKLDGAPSRDDVGAWRTYLKTKKLRAFSVTVKIASFERGLEDNSKPGKSGQVLKINLNVELIGTGIPDSSMALTGQGKSTVAAEVGKTLRPREEELTIEDALKDAITSAINEAVTKLRKAGKGK